MRAATRRLARASSAAALGLVAGCGSHSNGDGPVVDAAVDTRLEDPGGALADGEPTVPTGACNAVVQQRAIEGWTHVPVCSRVSYGTKPSSSGNHYPMWAAYQSYDASVPPGFWVHDLEHGGIVFTYNCANGCAGDVAAAQALIDARPSDPLCTRAGDPRVRMTMAPDPTLDVRFAASAWGWTLRADCFDPVVFGEFVTAHYGGGREATCRQGLDLSVGGIQPGCGD